MADSLLLYFASAKDLVNKVKQQADGSVIWSIWIRMDRGQS